MANTIKIKRGTSSNLQSLSLADGELAFTTDDNNLYIGNQNKKVQLTKVPNASISVVGGGKYTIIDNVLYISTDGTTPGPYVTAELDDSNLSGLTDAKTLNIKDQMTWEEFVNSDKNTFNFYIDGTKVYYDQQGAWFISLNGVAVKSTDPITKGITYSISS